MVSRTLLASTRRNEKSKYYKFCLFLEIFFLSLNTHVIKFGFTFLFSLCVEDFDMRSEK